jgi:hypothetical protein
MDDLSQCELCGVLLHPSRESSEKGAPKGDQAPKDDQPTRFGHLWASAGETGPNNSKGDQLQELSTFGGAALR